MIKTVRKLLIESKVKEILQDMQFNTLSICPIKIAEKANITIQAKPGTSTGVSGMFIKNGDNFGIMYATHIENQGFQNFSIAHELGHYYLDGHIENILTDGIHTSDEKLSSTNIYEQEANYFASVLLMPSHLIQDNINQNDLSWQLVKNISENCKTSLEATARRVIALSKEPCALLIHKNNKPWNPIKSLSWSWYLENPQFPDLDYCDYENLTNYMEECDLSDWNIVNRNNDEYQCKYSSIHFENDSVDKIMTLLLLEEKDG